MKIEIKRGDLKLATLKMSVVHAFHILVYLIVGFVLTNNVLRVIYEYFGILFKGDVWVNWFGVSFLLYFFYTIIRTLFIQKSSDLYKKRLKSTIFRLLFLVSLYAVFIPFIIGENPF